MKRNLKSARQGRSRHGASTVAYALLVNNLPGAVYRCLNDEQWTMEFVSEGIERLSGYPPSAFAGQATLTFADLIHPKDREELAHRISSAMAARGSFRATYRICALGGDVKWVEEQGSAVLDDRGEVWAREGFISDITSVKNAEALLREQAALLDHARDAIYVMDMDGRFTYWNKGAERLYKWTSSEVIGQTYRELFRDAAEIFSAGYRTAVQEGEWWGECTQADRLGNAVDAEVRWTLVPMDEAEGTAQKILAISFDIAERKTAQATMSRLAYFDSLTELPNRANLLDQLRKALSSSARAKTIGALMFCDLDNFKALNDSMGHAAGDLLLQTVARRMRNSVREADLVARLGGDEFVIMLPPAQQTLDEAALRADTVAEKILASLSKPVPLPRDVHTVTASIGITLFDGATESVESVLMKADAAMYQAKSAGRNTLRFYDPETQASLKARLKLERDLKSALSKDQFVLYYQPQIDSAGAVTGAEALVRWQHADGRLLFPVEFIRAAETTGQIVEIGSWILSTACEVLADWKTHPETAHLSLSVNISPRQFVEPEFVPMAEAIFSHTGADLRRLKFELTESLLVTDVGTTAAKMDYLKSLGLTFSLDDFGTGYSSLSYLRKLPLDELKIDTSFVRDVLTNHSDASIVRSIIALAESLGLKVIAEGVETVGQRDFLLLAGCYAYQGFLYERALPNELFIRYAASLH